MKVPLPLFPTTVVGSMPRPQYVKDLLAAGSRTGAHDAGWQRRMNDAVRYIIGMQEQAGINLKNLALAGRLLREKHGGRAP